MINYEPVIRDYPKVVDVTSAWGELITIIKDIIVYFGLKTQTALEFGVERGYSTTALANYFDKVIGVDTWDWDVGDGVSRTYEDVKIQLSEWDNIMLIQKRFEDYILGDKRRYDLIHVDIGYDTHEYYPTLKCGEWAVNHSDCVLFHDTVSFPGVMRACNELAEMYGFDFYNYEEQIGPAGRVCGLGILIKRK